MMVTNEYNRKNEDNLKKKTTPKMKTTSKMKTTLKTKKTSKKKLAPHIKEYYLKVFSMTSHPYSHGTTDIKTEMLSGVQTGKELHMTNMI